MERRSDRGRATLPLYQGSVLPKPFQIEEFTHFIGEYVDHEVKGIHNDPAGLITNACYDGLLTGFFQAIHNRLAKRLEMGIAGTGGNDEVIRNRGDVAHLEDAQAVRLLIVQCLDALLDWFWKSVFYFLRDS